MKKCLIENCESKTVGRGLCSKHHQRLMSYGDANYTTYNRGDGNTPEKRFWSRVTITADDDRCWEWQGRTNKQGYGVLEYKNTFWRAHRLSWFLYFGKKPQLHILHSCDNPPCVNPKHLREGTNAENVKDKLERGRQLRGEQLHNAKLTENKIRQIRNLKGKLENKEIANLFQIGLSTVSGIHTKRRWAWVN